ncbi:unnamed protein product, partial [Pylaiella littoralis]
MLSSRFFTAGVALGHLHHRRSLTYRYHASHPTPVLAFSHSVLLHNQESANTKRPVIRKLSTRSFQNHPFRQWYSRCLWFAVFPCFWQSTAICVRFLPIAVFK